MVRDSKTSSVFAVASEASKLIKTSLLDAFQSTLTYLISLIVCQNGESVDNETKNLFFLSIDISTTSKMYCLQWLIPVLLIPKPMNPALLYNHVMFMVLYLFGFFVERKPCTICSLVLYSYYI